MEGKKTNHDSDKSTKTSGNTKPEVLSAIQELEVEVVWGNIAKAKGDIHFVGHYQGVLPQKAELALDNALSGNTDGSGEKGIIREWTKRGLLRGALGEIVFFPWDPERIIAVAGMGRPGTFHVPQLKILARSIARSAGLLPQRKTIATVLIGAGVGNLRLKDAAQTLVEGIAEALKDDPFLKLEKLRIVERYLDRAIEILHVLKELNDNKPDLRLNLKPELSHEEGKAISPEFSCSLVLASLANTKEPVGSEDGGTILDKLLENLTDKGEISEKAREKFDKIREKCKGGDNEEVLRQFAMRLRLREEEDDGQDHDNAPARVAFWADGQNIHAAAITNTVTVTEREIAGRMGLVERAVERLVERAAEPLMDPPYEEQLKQSAETLLRLSVHNDVKDILWRGESLVVEVDAKLARVQWEMLPSEDDSKPLGVVRAIARQLRTGYSPRLNELYSRQKLKALVIGDPGDPALGHSLEHAQKEALEVFKLLKGKEIETKVLIGAPEPGTNAGVFHDQDIPAADYFEVVRILLCEDFDIVHYCGHAQFDPDFSERAGWVFKGGVLTARDLEGMERPPSLVVANACVTAQFGQSTAPLNSGQPPLANLKNNPGLVASLAEEFFRRGISDYIGTAWEVPSVPAAAFATAFYERLLAKESLGAAVRKAREELYNRRKTKGFGAVWAAYQHYGDPTRVLESPIVEGNPD